MTPVVGKPLVLMCAPANLLTRLSSFSDLVSVAILSLLWRVTLDSPEPATFSGRCAKTEVSLVDFEGGSMPSHSPSSLDALTSGAILSFEALSRLVVSSLIFEVAVFVLVLFTPPSFFLLLNL